MLDKRETHWYVDNDNTTLFKLHGLNVYNVEVSLALRVYRLESLEK